MNQSYGRLVSRAAIAATAMASALHDQNFCVVVYRFCQYSGCAGGFAGGHCRLADQPAGGSLFATAC